MKEKNTVKEKVKSVNEEVRELTDEELAKVVGGAGDGSCPNYYTRCTQANCLNANCNHLVQNGDVCSCGNGVSGKFAVLEVDIGGFGSGDNIGKLAKR